MVVNLVVKLTDGEELVVEGLEDEAGFEDPRERTIEVRRAVQRLALEGEPASGFGKERVVKPAKRIVKSMASPRPPRTEGLTPLDQDRAASVADEGGASAAKVEAQPTPAPAAGAALESPGGASLDDYTGDLDETPPLGFRPPERLRK